mmetsp:Transcript_20/g.51  ORF Transcript_20/g.51 Transcript_20/m.51 type:complete len:214 (+) Transcript_20:89-730(+)
MAAHRLSVPHCPLPFAAAVPHAHLAITSATAPPCAICGWCPPPSSIKNVCRRMAPILRLSAMADSECNAARRSDELMRAAAPPKPMEASSGGTAHALSVARPNATEATRLKPRLPMSPRRATRRLSMGPATPSRVKTIRVGAVTRRANESWTAFGTYSRVGSINHGSVDQEYPPPGARRIPRVANSRAESTVKCRSGTTLRWARRAQASATVA